MSYPVDFEGDPAQRRFWSGDRPRIVCLCGSTRFFKTFQEASLRETLAGHIVLSIGAAVSGDDEHFATMAEEDRVALKTRLDALHFRKIELADEVLILNVDDYVGESTGRELLHARRTRKVVRWWQQTPRALAGEVLG